MGIDLYIRAIERSQIPWLSLGPSKIEGKRSHGRGKGENECRKAFKLGSKVKVLKVTKPGGVQGTSKLIRDLRKITST